MSGFEWDPKKEAKNASRHVDFSTASRIWDGPVLERPDNRRDYGEDRIVAFGAVDDLVLAVVYTWRAQKRRIISARKADRRERRGYQDAIGQREPGERD